MVEERLIIVARPVYGARNAFAHIVSALKHHQLLSYVKLVFHEGDPRSIVREYRGRGRVVVLYGLSSPVFLELMEELASVAKEAITIVGGPHAEGAYWQLLRLGVYAAVVGDGENAIAGIVEHLLGWRDISDVPNIAYVEGGRFKVTSQRLVNLDDYEPYSSEYNLYPPIEIMRGCPYRCRFCQVPWMFKGRVRFRSVESVVRAAEKYVVAGRDMIRFIAPIGLAYGSTKPGEPNIEALESLLKGVRSVGGKPFLGTFPSETRPEYVTHETLTVLRRYAANKKLAIGLQSGSNKVLKLSGRDHTVEDALEAISLAVEYGFKPVVDILFSLPGEDEEAVDETIKVMWRLAEMNARMRLHTFIPLPGTPFAHAKPKPVHPHYKPVIRKLLGKGLIEGDWVEQEKLAPKVYCLTMLDPAPTQEPRPVLREADYCKSYWSEWVKKLKHYSIVLEAVSRG